MQKSIHRILNVLVKAINNFALARGICREKAEIPCKLNGKLNQPIPDSKLKITHKN